MGIFFRLSSSWWVALSCHCQQIIAITLYGICMMLYQDTLQPMLKRQLHTLSMVPQSALAWPLKRKLLYKLFDMWIFDFTLILHLFLVVFNFLLIPNWSVRLKNFSEIIVVTKEVWYESASIKFISFDYCVGWVFFEIYIMVIMHWWVLIL